MSICGINGHQRLRFLGSSELPKLSFPRRAPGFRRRRRSDVSVTSKDAVFKFLPRAASAASPPSPAQYPEQLLGANRKQKRQRIAGIDQDELQDPSLLADSDSCFCEFRGVQIHHKICSVESATSGLSDDSSNTQPSYQTITVGFPMILLHGFGASLFSWNRVMKPLAEIAGSKVLAFDRPAFGLTSRMNLSSHSSADNQDDKPLNPYSMVFSVLATIYFIDFLAARKAIIVGHSAGALVAVEAYFKEPERVAALILVAPAILAPFALQKEVKDCQNGKDEQAQGQPEAKQFSNFFIWSYDVFSKLMRYVAQTIIEMLKGMRDMLNSLYKKVLSAILRSAIGLMLVRMAIDKFGVLAIRNSWYNPSQVTDHVLQGYTKPLRVKGWDKALVEYTLAMLTDSSSESKLPLAKRLGEISCPVLIITGDTDRLVPAWNSERLSRAIPGSCLEIIKNCGHLPHEEKTEEFLTIVDRFLQGVLGAMDKQHLPAVA